MQKKKSLDISLLPPHLAQYHHRPDAYILDSLTDSSVLTPANLQSFLSHLLSMYHGPSEGVHYHNLTHAFDVMVVLDQFILKMDLIAVLQMHANDRFYLLLAALAHDSGHEGLTNSYYIKHHKDLALTYLYQSPLQHMHASNLLKLIHQHNIPIPYEKRQMMVSMILATDNAHHQIKLKKLKELEQEDGEVSQIMVRHRQFILNCCMHAADINSPSKDLKLFTQWNYRVTLEFEAQRKLEEGQNYKGPSPLESLKQELWFIEDLVLPFYKELVIFLPGICSYVEAIQKNRALVCERVEQEQKT